jgi:hypothetical protein
MMLLVNGLLVMSFMACNVFEKNLKKKFLFQINCFYCFHIVLTYFDILKKKKTLSDTFQSKNFEKSNCYNIKLALSWW